MLVGVFGLQNYKEMNVLQKIALKILSQDKPASIGTQNEATRYAWMEKTLKNIQAGSKILDAGAGELKFKKYCDHLIYVSQDFGQYDGKGNSEGLQTKTWDNSKLDIVSDITSMPVENACFDAVMCNEVLEHVPDPLSALKELDRVLKVEGYLILTAPFCSLTHFAPYHFSTGFSRYFYEKHLHELNYEILDIHANGNYFEYLAQELRRLPKVSSQYSEIKPDRIQKNALQTMLHFLQECSQNDSGSKELLCFGYQILARKG